MVSVSETLESLCSGRIQIVQSKAGYRYSIDPFLLTTFACFPRGAEVADLGSGSGIIPLLLSQRPDVKKITGFELQKSFVERSQKSVVLNGLEEKVVIEQIDVRSISERCSSESFDVVVTNPPYRAQGTGRYAPNDERSIARHEFNGGLQDFLAAAKYLLKNGGRFFVIYLAERVAELLTEMRMTNLEPKRMRMVHSRVGEPARLVLAEGRKNGKPGLTVESPLYLYSGEGRDYTDEVLAMYDNQ